MRRRGKAFLLFFFVALISRFSPALCSAQATTPPDVFAYLASLRQGGVQAYSKITLGDLLSFKNQLSRRNSVGQTPLMVSASLGLTSISRIFLSFHPDLSLQDKQGRTALYYFIREYEMMDKAEEPRLRQLIFALQQLQRDNPYTNLSDLSITPAMASLQKQITTLRSAKSQVMELCQLAVTEGASITVPTKALGGSPIGLAFLTRSDEQLVLALINNQNAKTVLAGGNTLLHMAAAKGDVLLTQRLISLGAPVNALNKAHQRPIDISLSLPSSLLHAKVTRALIQHGSLESKIPNSSYLFKIFSSQDIERQYENGFTALHYAAANNQEGMALLFLSEEGASIDSLDNKRETPLQVAITHYNTYLAGLLIVNGANVHHTDLNGNTPLHDATLIPNSPALVRALLSYGANPNVKNNALNTPVHLAAFSSTDSRVLSILFSATQHKVTTINDKNREGNTALFLAAKGNHLASARFLLSRGASLTSDNNAGFTPLSELMSTNSPLVPALLQGKLAKLTDEEKNTALIQAAKVGAVAPIYLALLKKPDVNINAQNQEGKTALFYATQSKNLPMMQSLVLSGASPFLTSTSGPSPLQMAFSQGVAATQVMVPPSHVQNADPQGQTPLFYAIKSQDITAVSFLLAEGAQLSHKDLQGRTPLLATAGTGSIKIFKLLLEKGASPKARTNSGDTALHIALREGSSDIASYLITAKDGLNLQNSSGDTPLLIAARLGDKVHISSLLHSGASPNIQNLIKESPLGIAAGQGKTAIVKALLASGASPLLQDKRGNTPLMNALLKKHSEAAQLLLPVSDIFTTNGQGLSPLLLAMKGGPAATDKLLTNESPNLRDSQGNTPLHVAILNDISPAVMSYLIARGTDLLARNNRGETPYETAKRVNNQKAMSLIKPNP